MQVLSRVDSMQQKDNTTAHCLHPQRRKTVGNIPLHNPLQRTRAKIGVVGNLVDDRHEPRELVAGAVGEQGWHAGGLHLGVAVVQLDEARVDVFAR